MSDFDYDALQDLVITIEDETGVETDLQLLTVFEYEDTDYAVFTEDDDSEEGNAYIFSMTVGTDKDGQPEVDFSQVEDENLAEELFAIFQEIISEGDDEIVDMIPESADDDDDDDDDSKWDQFITKKLH